MKILVISQYYYPEPFKINEICESLVKLQNEVTVITGKPNYPSGKFYSGYEKIGSVEENINGVKVIRVNMLPRGNNHLSLILNYLSYPRKAIQRLKKMDNSYDLVYVYQLSPVLMVKPAIYLKKKYNLKVYLYCLDLWPESLKVLGIRESNIVYKFIKYYSKKMYKLCDRISVTSPSFIDYLHDVHNLDKEKIDYIPQHGENMFLQVKDVFYRDKMIVTYAGNVGKAQDFKCLIDALNVVDKNTLQKLTIRVIGSGSYLIELKKSIKQNELEDVFEFIDRVPTNELLAYFNETNFFFLSLEKGNAISSTIPTKLQTYMASGRGIIGTIDGICKEIINSNGCGIMSSAGDCDGLADILKLIVKMDVGELNKFSIKSRNYFLKNFTLDRIDKVIMQNMEEIINDKV